MGKVAVDSICTLEDSLEIARLHPAGLPPHAELDEDVCSHRLISLSVVRTGGEEPLLTLTGKAQAQRPGSSVQPCTGTHDVLRAARHDDGAGAGWNDRQARDQGNVRRRQFSVVWALDMETMGVDVRRDGRTKIGAIGVAVLLASMGLLYGINSACIIGTTVGSSGDIWGRNDWIEHLERWFKFDRTVPTNGEWLQRLRQERQP